MMIADVIETLLIKNQFAGLEIGDCSSKFSFVFLLIQTRQKLDSLK